MTGSMPLIDLHTHLLPGVDDGAASVEDAVAMLRVAHSDGIRRLAATPHMHAPAYPNSDLVAINDAFAEFLSRLEERARHPRERFLADLEIYLGAEYFVCDRFLADLDSRRLLTLNGSRYVLVELSPYLGRSGIEVALERIVGAGLVPVVAHVERVLEPRDAATIAARWVARGALLQVNASSLEGGFRSLPRRTCFSLLKRGMVHLLASDTHDATRRPPVLSRAWEIVARRFGDDRARMVFEETPARILDNRAVSRAA